MLAAGQRAVLVPTRMRPVFSFAPRVEDPRMQPLLSCVQIGDRRKLAPRILGQRGALLIPKYQFEFVEFPEPRRLDRVQSVKRPGSKCRCLASLEKKKADEYVCNHAVERPAMQSGDQRISRLPVVPVVQPYARRAG